MRSSGRSYKRLLVVWIALIALLAAACGSDNNKNGNDAAPGSSVEEEPSIKYGGKVTFALEFNIETLIPGQGSIRQSVAHAVYDPLIELTADGRFEPFLAESLEPNDDLTVWTLKLRDGIKFHDGTALDAEVLAWNFNTLHFHEASRSFGSLAAAGVEELRIVDPLTVEYVLADSYAAFPDVLRGPVGWPVSQVAYESNPEAFDQNPIGTGPFVVTEWRRMNNISLKRNDNYWLHDSDGNQLPYLDELEFRFITDEESRMAALEAGDVEMMHTLRGTYVERIIKLAEGSNFEASVHVGNNAGTSIFNVLEPPLDDVRVRRALTLAVDISAIQLILGDQDLTEPATQYFSKDSPWYSEAVAAAYPLAGGTDVEQARELIEEYRNDPNRSDNKAVGESINVEFNCPPDPSLLQVSQAYQGMWDDIGVVTKLNSPEGGTLHTTNAIGSPDTDPPFRGSYSINCWRSDGGMGDPLTVFQNDYGPIATTPANVTNFVHPEIDRQVEILRSTIDFDARHAAVEQIGLILAEYVPLYWEASTPTVVGYRSGIVGVTDWKLPSGSLGTGTPVADVRFHEVRFVAN